MASVAEKSASCSVKPASPGTLCGYTRYVGAESFEGKGRAAIAATGKHGGQGMIERRPSRRIEPVRIAGDFRGAADADAIAQPRDRDLVALVHHGGYWCAVCVDDRHSDRIAFDGIDRNGNADGFK